MPNNKKDEEEARVDVTKDRGFMRGLRNLNGLLNNLNISIYGTDGNNTEIDELNTKFNQILSTELDSLTNRDEGDISSFINQLYTKNKKETSLDSVLKKQFANLNIENQDSAIASFISEQYRNRLLRQSDLHEVSSQLIELQEAIKVTRDAIISPDILTGRINRVINFGPSEAGDEEDYKPIIEHLEERFDLQNKIKNFIVEKGLEYGEYYVYMIPYSAIFNDFMKNKSKYVTSKYNTYAASMYGESVVSDLSEGEDENSLDKFIESCYESYVSNKDIREEFSLNENAVISKGLSIKNNKTFKENFSEDLKNILSRITVCNESVPLPILEEGFESSAMYMKEFVSESGDSILTEANKSKKLKTDEDAYTRMLNGLGEGSSEGIFKDNKSKKTETFDDIKDCYMKLIPPTRIVPITIMDEEIGYFYLQAEDITPLSGVLSSTLYHQRYDELKKENDIIGNIADRIIQKFDKKFLKSNPKFKKIIVEAINYYNLNEKRLRFQFIPKEYMVTFKINKDAENRGTSMIEPSLFYAKLYLMLLLFKIMSIVTFSNDTKVNYIKQSGLDKSLINKVQDIARQKQARNVNVMDLFSYTTLINKIGNGTEMYIPVGKSGERPIETEILSGQEVQLNNELMELLRNSYILATGVPSAIMNYLNEADFAKSIETANTKFDGRVVNYRLDFNEGITTMYRRLAKWCTSIPESVINKMTITLPTSKSKLNTAKSEMISNYTSIADFLIALYFGDHVQDEKYEYQVRNFRKILAKRYLPMLDFEEIDKIYDEAKMKQNEDKTDPSIPTDNYDDIDPSY